MSDLPVTTSFFPGAFSILLNEGDSLNDLGARLAGYNKERFEAVALRFYSGEETVVTIYAHDKFHRKNMEDGAVKLPVHKFKINCTLESFFKEIQQLNFTVSSTEYVIDDMEVTNK